MRVCIVVTRFGTLFDVCCVDCIFDSWAVVARCWLISYGWSEYGVSSVRVCFLCIVRCGVVWFKYFYYAHHSSYNSCLGCAENDEEARCGE